jgi:hypothetical protein
MSKFLKLVAESRPLAAHELNKVTPIKRIFHRALLADSNKAILEDIGLEGIQITNTSDDIILKFNDGTVITYSVEVVREEDNEVVDAVRDAADQEAKREPRGPVASDLKILDNEQSRLKPVLSKAIKDRIARTKDAIKAVTKG